MEQSASSRDSRQALQDTLTKLGIAAFDPQAAADSRATALKAYQNCIESIPAVSLIPALNILIQPGRMPEWLRSQFMNALTLVPLRPDGVRATMEFIFTVHPSSNLSLDDIAGPQTQGASITQEALTMAARLLAMPPLSQTPDTWFSGIAPQLLQLLDGYHGFEMTKVASYVIGFGVLGRKKFGAPGTAGWASFALPLIKAINPDVDPSQHADGQTNSTPDFIDLTRRPVIVSPTDLSTAIRRLQSLILSHPNPGLSKRLLSPILLQLWTIASWSSSKERFEEVYRLPARNMLAIYLKIDMSPEKVLHLIKNLVRNGSGKPEGATWRYEATSDGCLEILDDRLGPAADRFDESALSQMGPRSAELVELLESVSTDEDLSAIFLALFRQWLQPTKRQSRDGILYKSEISEPSDSDPIIRASEGSVMQKMMEKYPERLVKRSDHLIDLVSEVLQESEIPGSVDGSVGIALSLLNLVVTVPGFQRKQVKREVLKSIENSLDRIMKGTDEEISTTARNLSLLFKYRDELDDPTEATTAPTDRQVEDRKTYNLGLSYITQTDSPPPVRSEGLSLIQGLIQANSPILDVPAILVLMSSLLDDNEDYINLRVIRIFTLLADKHPRSTIKELLERYVDANETATTDARLRFGEALLQVIERFGQTFSGDIAQQAVEALLFVAGRRGHRPKAQAKQDKDEKFRQLKKARNDDPAEDTQNDMTAEEKAREEILKTIVEGWGSKRGSEDIRIRASSLSILAVGIETNIGGIGAQAVSAAVDLCLGVLSMEQELEKGILRRSAIILILSFARSLAKSKEMGKRIGFGLTDDSREDILRILRYVFESDNDGLVKQHAADVIESLENWKMSDIMGELRTSSEPALSQLAGLAINPVTTISGESNRPRIEEIE